MFQKAIKDIIGGFNMRHVWVHQALHDITAKYKRTVLGSLWLSGGMIVTSLSLSIVFGALFKMPLQQALPYTMSGILIFGCIGYVFNEAPELFMSSAGTIKNIAYPFTYFSYLASFRLLLLFLHNLVIYEIFTVIIGAGVLPHWSIVLGIAVMMLVVMTWGMVIGMVAARYRDMRFMMPYLGQLVSILTPIFWKLDGLHGPIASLMAYNPFYVFIQIVRRPILGGWATPHEWAVALAYAAGGLVIWFLSFSAFRRRIPFWL